MILNTVSDVYVLKDAAMPLRIFDDAVVIMTGGASGIGRAMSAQLVRRGASVILADRDVELAQETAATLGEKATAAACDVTDFDAVRKVVADAFDAHGRLDYFFNNAGIAIGGEAAKCEISDWNRVLDVNIRGVVHGIQAAYPKMVEQGFGHIVNTASMAGLMPTPGIASYGMSKHAVVGVSKALRVEGERHGIRVSCFCPGFIRTPILTGGKYGGNVEDIPEEKQLAAIEKSKPMDPDAFAEKAIDQVARNVPFIVLPSWWKLMWWANRLSPSLGLAIGRRMFREMRDRMEPQ